MKLWEICQLCGRRRKTETNDNPKHNLRGHIWKYYDLGDFGLEHPYDDYEIHICADCLEDHPYEMDDYWIDNHTKAIDIHYDFDEIKKSILESLEILVGSKQ